MFYGEVAGWPADEYQFCLPQVLKIDRNSSACDLLLHILGCCGATRIAWRRSEPLWDRIRPEAEVDRRTGPAASVLHRTARTAPERVRAAERAGQQVPSADAGPGGARPGRSAACRRRPCRTTACQCQTPRRPCRRRSIVHVPETTEILRLIHTHSPHPLCLLCVAAFLESLPIPDDALVHQLCRPPSRLRTSTHSDDERPTSRLRTWS